MHYFVGPSYRNILILLRKGNTQPLRKALKGGGGIVGFVRNLHGKIDGEGRYKL